MVKKIAVLILVAIFLQMILAVNSYAYIFEDTWAVVAYDNST